MILSRRFLLKTGATRYCLNNNWKIKMKNWGLADSRRTCRLPILNFAFLLFNFTWWIILKSVTWARKCKWSGWNYPATVLFELFSGMDGSHWCWPVPRILNQRNFGLPSRKEDRKKQMRWVAWLRVIWMVHDSAPPLAGIQDSGFRILDITYTVYLIPSTHYSLPNTSIYVLLQRSKSHSGRIPSPQTTGEADREIWFPG